MMLCDYYLWDQGMFWMREISVWLLEETGSTGHVSGSRCRGTEVGCVACRELAKSLYGWGIGGRGEWEGVKQERWGGAPHRGRRAI